MSPEAHVRTATHRPDGRNKARAPHRCAVRILAVNGAMTRIHHVSTYDLSTSGLGFISQHRFAPSDHLVFALQRDTRTVLIRCQVVHSRPLADGSYHTGTRFMDMVSHVRGKEQIPAAWLGFQVES